MEQRLPLVGLLMAAGLLSVLAVPLFLGQVYIQDDLGIFHLTTRAFYSQSLQRGDNVLWCPRLFCGYYLHGDGQVGMYHPLHWFLYRFFPLSQAFTLELLLSYPCLLAGAFVLLRRWQLPAAAATFGALVLTFSSFPMLQFVHPNIVAIVAHTPWLLVAIDTTLCSQDERRVRWAQLGVVGLTTSQLLIGHPQAVWLSGLLEVLYSAWRLPAWQGWGRLWALGSAKLFGVLGGSVQLLPTWDVVSQSNRAAAGFIEAYRYRDSLEPINVVQWIAPYVAKTRAFGSRFTQEFGIYNGAIATVVPLWLYLRRRTLGTNAALAHAALWLGLLGLLLAMGKYGYLYHLQAYVPFIQRFGVAVRYMFLVNVAMAVAAALFFVDLVTLRQQGLSLSWRQLRPLLLVPLASVVVAGMACWLRQQPALAPTLAAQLATPAAILLGPLLIGVATALILAAARGVRYALLGLIVFTVLDQGTYGLSYLWHGIRSVPLAALGAGQALPPAPTSYRVQSDNSFLTLQGLSLAAGYVAFRPQTQLSALHLKRLQLASVEWVQIHTPWAAATSTETLPPELAQDTHVTTDALGRPSSWARVPAPLPRVRLLTHERVSLTPKQDIDRIDIATTALVPETLGLAGGEAGSVALDHDRPGQIRLQATLPTRQLLVLSESWHAGWRATVNGVGRPVVRVYGDFLGCVLEPGQHTVEFRFQPQSFRLGAWLSSIGLGLALCAYGGPLLRYPEANKDGRVAEAVLVGGQKG